MKAIIQLKYGSPDVLEMQEIAKPRAKKTEILVKVHAASVTRADGMMRTGYPLFGRLFIGLLRPKSPILGTGFAGVVEAVGKSVVQFKVGDQVFGESLEAGTNAEYVCVPETGVVALKPETITYTQAAPLCDGALTSMNFLQDMAQVKGGQKVLINGASGSLGTAAVQLAKEFGAEVTAVCSSANVDLARSLGAAYVVDYTLEDFSKAGKKYDVIYDTVGTLSFLQCKGVLVQNGIYMSPVLNISLVFQMLWTMMFGNKKAMFSATGIRPVAELRELLSRLVVLVEAGRLKTVIDKTYPLADVAQAHSYIDTGRKKGNVVVALL